MSEIEIGEYIRTKRGKIGKVCAYEDLTVYDDKEKSVTFHSFDTDKGAIADVEVSKHSKNQKELIQEGDILEYQINKLSFTKIGEVKKYKDARSFKDYLGVEGFNLEQITILKILTKEKFEDESYKVGE